MKTNIILFLIVFNCGISVAQPSFTINVEFNTFKNNEIVEYDSLILNYKLLNRYNKEVPKHQNIRQNKLKNRIIFSGTVVYNHLLTKFVYKKDTMSLYFKNHLDRNKFIFKIDTLEFKKGKYFIKDNKIEKIDFNKSVTDYYN